MGLGRPWPRRTAALAGAALLIVTLGGCGLPRDDHPRPLADAPDGLGGSTAPPTTPAVPSGRSIALYFVGENALVKEQRSANLAADAESVIRLLLGGTTPEEKKRDDVVSRIPVDTELLDSSLRDGVLTLNLSDQINGVVGDGAKAAYAQIVYTATELAEVDAVQIRVEGSKLASVPTDSGNLDRVGRNNYRSLAPA